MSETCSRNGVCLGVTRHEQETAWEPLPGLEAPLLSSNPAEAWNVSATRCLMNRINEYTRVSWLRKRQVCAGEQAWQFRCNDAREQRREPSSLFFAHTCECDSRFPTEMLEKHEETRRRAIKSSRNPGRYPKTKGRAFHAVGTPMSCSSFQELDLRRRPRGRNPNHPSEIFD